MAQARAARTPEQKAADKAKATKDKTQARARGKLPAMERRAQQQAKRKTYMAARRTLPDTEEDYGVRQYTINKDDYGQCPHCQAWLYPGELAHMQCCRKPLLAWPLTMLSRAYRGSTRYFNCAFSFATSKAQEERGLAGSKGPRSFTIHGHRYAYMGSLKETDGKEPWGCQTYVHDGVFDEQKELRKRRRSFEEKEQKE